MKIYLILGAIAILGVGAYVMNSSAVTERKMIMEKAEMMKKEGAMEKNAMMKKDGVMESDEKAMGKSPTTTEGMMQKSKVDGEYDVTTGVPVAGMKNVLFFYASWCPTCRAADADITAKQSDIPSGLVIHKVDYDTSTDLKKKYGVTYQHTFVQVDEKGEMITKWSGGNLDTIIEKLK